MGIYNEPHIEDIIRCEEGSSAVTVRFAVQDDDLIAELAAEEEALMKEFENDKSTDMDEQAE